MNELEQFIRDHISPRGLIYHLTDRRALVVTGDHEGLSLLIAEHDAGQESFSAAMPKEAMFASPIEIVGLMFKFLDEARQ